MYRLIFLNGRLKGRRVAVQQGTLVIGRDPSCQIDLADDDEVSRQHASLEQRKDGVWLKDMGALNKPQVNGQPVSEARLRHGDKIEVGRTLMEFQVIEARETGTRRRVSKVQVITFAAIAVVLALEAVFVFLFPLWQGEDPSLQAAATADASATGVVAAAASGEVAVATGVVTGAPQDVAAVSTSAGPDEVAAQMEELKAAVAGLREQVQGMATGAALKPPPTALSSAVVAAVEAPFPRREEPPPLIDVPAIREQRPPMEEPPPPSRERRPPESDPLVERAREMMVLAEAEIARADHASADGILERIQLMAPDFLPAYVERARLSEKRGQLARAGEQWQEVMKRSVNTPLYSEAAAERQRLARVEAAILTTRQGSDAKAPADRLPRRIRIVSVDRERLPSAKDYDEMRILRINLKSRLSEGPIDGDDVEVMVTFYDRVAGKDEVTPSGATVPEEALRVDSAWAAGEQKSVTATYTLPKGFRQDEQDTTGQTRVYEGYRVQVFYKRELQDEDALPRSLLGQAAAALPDTALRTAPTPSRPVPRR